MTDSTTQAIARINAVRDLARKLDATKRVSTPTLAQYDAVLDNPVFSDVEQRVYDRTYQKVLTETADALKAAQAGLGAVRRHRLNLPVKSYRFDLNGDLLIAGWGLLFAKPGYPDLDNQTFPRDTELMLEFYKEAPLFYEHGQDERYGFSAIGQRVSVTEYDHGLWAVHRLFASHPLFDNTLAEINANGLGYSGDSTLHLMGVSKRNELKVFPLIAWSLVRYLSEPGLGAVSVVTTEEIEDDAV